MQDPRQAYNAQAAPAAGYPYAAVPAQYPGAGRYPANYGYNYGQQYAAPTGRGRGYGGPVAAYPQYPPFAGNGYGAPYGDAGMMMRPRRKRAFVGGSLETQRQWEQSTLCCFSVQGGCKFGTHCRFSHEDDGKRPCQFGAHCRVGHGSRATGEQQQQQPAATPAAPASAPQQQ
eukprot:CAMPEP_0176425314 /NCGR_PEP_ID=MMETSP0127-20121128/11323_1 /TAXON_ID=938130 /ORGANISM="Platyophrya macrostoma, Strain WH" /LENGTH=172 /DNA_ID=CAMNT_0017806467 /DNA_START=39 /DNA_END=557 /DNA_ORIENTATION=+